MTPGRPPSTWQRACAWPERHAATALLVLVLLFALGAVFAVRAPVDRLGIAPDARLRVRAELPGFDPVTVEQQVTAPLEAALMPLPGLRQVIARSRTGEAQLTLQFGSAAERDRAVEEARRRVAASAAYLPATIDPPAVAADRAGQAAIVYAVTAEPLSQEVARWARSILADPLHELPGVVAVTLEGSEQHEILIQPDPRRLASLGLGFGDLLSALRGADYAPSRTAARDLVMTPGGSEAIAARAVYLPGGEPIALAEVARVSVVPRPAGEQPRHRSAPALRLTVQARSPRDAPRVAARVNAHLAWLRANDLVPDDVVIHSLHDESRATQAWRKRAAYHAAAAAVVLLGVVFAAFGGRAGGRVAAALAVWLTLSVAGLWRLGFTLSSATAAGLIVAGAPFAVLMVSPLSPAGFLLVAVTAGGSLAASLALAGAPASAAAAISLSLAIFIRWLMRAWIPPVARTTAWLARLDPRKRGPAPALAVSAAMAPLLLAAMVVIASALFTSGTGANGGTFRFRVLGEDRKQAESLAGAVLPSVHAIPRVAGVTTSAEREETWRLHLDEERMRDAEIVSAEVGRALAIADGGLIVGEVVSAERRLPLRMRLAPGAAGESFERLLLRGERDHRRAVYLRDVGFVERVAEARERLRVNGRPAVEITAQWADGEARHGLERFCGRIEVPEGIAVECVVADSPV